MLKTLIALLALIALFVIVGVAISGKGPSNAAIQDPKKQKEEAEFQRAVAGAKQLRASARNPDSFKLESALIMDDGAVCYEFRSQNGFGGMDRAQAVLAPSGKFKSSESSGFGSLWNKECGGKTGEDDTKIVVRAAGFN